VAQALNRRRRRWILIAIAVIVVLLAVLGGLSGFYVDILWFREVGYSGVFWKVFWSKLTLGVIFGAIFFGILLANLIIVRRLTPRFRVFSPEQEIIERYRTAFEPYARYLIPAFAALIALFVGVGASGQWKTFLLWRSVGDIRFGAQYMDPLFHRDPSFYIFVLPFQKFVQGWLFSALVGVTLITAIGHYLTGGIRTQAQAERVTPQVKAHLSVLLGLIVLTKAWGYYLGKFDLLTSPRGVVTGASYTDIHAQLPALKVLVFIAIACALLFLVNIRFRGWALPVIGIGLLGVVSIVLGGIVPAAVQKLQVAPQEFQKEQPYIKSNIAGTRFAYGLDRVNLQQSTPATQLSSDQITGNQPTVQNVRLWTPAILRRNYEATQRLQQYYEFSDVDVDRYPIEGAARLVMLSAREVSQNGIPTGGTWQNKHLVYTHGYGAVASAVSTVTTTGGPDFVLQDIPPTGTAIPLDPGKGSQVYYGERAPDVPYLVVDSKTKELNYPSGQTSVFTQYAGTGGIPLGGFFRRLVFAFRYRDVNLLISGLIDSNSKILINRDIGTRVMKAAPFLKYDKDPYAAIVDGRLVYIWDAYTTTDLYPYSERVNLSTITNADLTGRANYIRNSVKVVVDAYDGTVRYYVVDPTDPLIKVWQAAFPHLLLPETMASADLRAHFRYPEDLLQVQGAEFANYHVTDPQTFYSRDRLWAIPGALPLEPKTAAPPGTFRPYYVLFKLPGSDTEHFVLFQPFTPPGRQNMVSYLAGGSDLPVPGESTTDAGVYGNLTAFQFPSTQNVNGPSQTRSLINQDPTVSAQITLLSQQGSTVNFGDMLIVPIEDAFLYVQPIFTVSSQTNAIPELKLVVVVNGGQVYLGTTLDDAMCKAFPGTPSCTTPTPGGGVQPPPTGGGQVATLLQQALQHFQAAEAALRNGDLATYQKEIQAAKALVQQANQVASKGTPSGPTPSPSATPTPSPT